MSAVAGIVTVMALFVALGFLWHGKEHSGHEPPCPSVTDSPACGACPLAERDGERVLEYPAGRRARPPATRFATRSTARLRRGKSPNETAASPVLPDCPVTPTGGSS